MEDSTSAFQDADSAMESDELLTTTSSMKDIMETELSLNISPQQFIICFMRLLFGKDDFRNDMALLLSQADSLKSV